MAAEKSHPILRAVATGLLTTAILSLIVYIIPGGWLWVFTKVGELYKIAHAQLTTNVPLPFWLIAALVLSILVAVLVSLILAVKWMIRTGAPAIESYVGEFRGVKWRWQQGPRGIQGLTSFCPVCDLQVHPVRTDVYVTIPRTAYRCDNGHWESKEFEGTPDDVNDLIRRLIHQQERQKQDSIQV